MMITVLAEGRRSEERGSYCWLICLEDSSHQRFGESDESMNDKWELP
jgi:hypothetical protein